MKYKCEQLAPKQSDNTQEGRPDTRHIYAYPRSINVLRHPNKGRSFVLKSKLMLRRKSNTCVACTEVSKHQLSSFPKHSGFLISDSLHVPSVLHLQGHRRTDCCRAGEAIIPHRTYSFRHPDCTQKHSVTSESTTPLITNL